MPHLTSLIATHNGPFHNYEFFPPLTDPGFVNLLDRIRRLTSPPFQAPLAVSVTWGAGGSTAERSLELAQQIVGMGVEVILHLTCTNMPKDKVDTALQVCVIHRREMAKLLTDGWAIRDVKPSVSPTSLLSEAILPEKRNTQSTLLPLPISSSTPMILSATSVRRMATTFASALLAILIRTPTQRQRRRISSGLRQSATPVPTLSSRNCSTMSTCFRSGSRLAVPRVSHRSLYHVIAC